MADEEYPLDGENPDDPESNLQDQPPQDPNTPADGGGIVDATADAMNAAGLLAEGAGAVADGAAAAAEGFGSVLEGAGGCLEGCGSCSIAVLIGIFLTAQAAFAIYK